MQLNSHVDFAVVAVERNDQVTVMLELVAPTPAAGTQRPPATVQVVLDRSGSMHGERLEAAKDALVHLVSRLDPGDRFGLVAFDDQVQVVVPNGPVIDKLAIRHAIRAVETGGMTNLSGGLLRGLQEAKRVAGDSGATLLLLSDGHANEGESDPAKLRSVAAGARDRHVTTTTIGIGLGYDEDLLSEIAGGGQGNHVFAEDGDGAAGAVAGEVDGLLSKTVQAASLTIRPNEKVDVAKLWNDLPATVIDGGIMVELGDLWAGETRKIVLTFDVPGKPALGLAQVAELELRYVAVPDFKEQTITLPVHVNVVPGDQAAGRIANPVVRTELVYQQVQDAKRKAADALLNGDTGGAATAFGAASSILDAQMLAGPSLELAEEQQVVASLREEAASGDAARAAKRSRAEFARKNRKRGR